MSYQQEKFQEIADKIREKTGITDEIKPSDFAKLQDDVFEAGREKERMTRWNNHLNGLKNGKTYGFAGKGWNDETFTPFTDIILGSGNAVSFFAYSGMTDLSETFNRYGTKLDCSQISNATSFFSYSLVTRVPEMNFAKATTIQGMFSYAENLERIEKLTISESCTLTNTFQNCTNLSYIRIGGKIGKSLDIHWSLLLKGSVESIISALSDTATGQTVTFNSVCIGDLYSESEWEEIVESKPNWTFALL